MTTFTQQELVDGLVEDADAEAPAPTKRPSRWSLKNWPVRWKVFAIVLVPLILAGAFGGLRIYSNAIEARDLQRAADRAEMVPAIVSYMTALNGAMLAPSAGGDTQAAMSTFDASRAELQRRLERLPRCAAGRPQGRHDHARRRPGAAGQGHLEHHRPCRPGHRLRADPADLRGRDHRVGPRRRRAHPQPDAGAHPRRRRPRSDDDGAAAGQPGRRAARARAAHAHDHPRRHRAVDDDRYEPGARHRVTGGSATAGRVRPPDRTHLRPGHPVGQQPGYDRRRCRPPTRSPPR